MRSTTDNDWAPYRDYVKGLIDRGYTAKRILDLLKTEKGFEVE
jgi:hypothetical protein